MIEAHVVPGSQPPGSAGPKRSLVLAGGGMRVAYQAGVLKALFEAGLTFDHADGTSGGTMNLAMLFSGQTPDEMVERWRALDPSGFVSFMPVKEYFRLDGPLAFGDADGILRDVFPQLGVDVGRIRAATGMEGTFNVCNFTTKNNRAVGHRQLSQELLVAGISLPIFMPPVRVGDDDYVDSVWVKDANMLEAVRRGAEEIWLVWCIGNAAAYRHGPFNQYVHMIEISASGALFAELDYIAELNERITRGDSPFGQRTPVSLKVIKPEYPLPLDPSYLRGDIDGATLVARGYSDGWKRLRRQGADDPLGETATRMRTPHASVSFRERWSGHWSAASEMADELVGGGAPFTVAIAVFVHDLEGFAAGQAGAATLYGSVALSGREALVRDGEFSLVDVEEGRRLRYEARFEHHGSPFVLRAERSLRPGSLSAPLEALKQVKISLHSGADDTAPPIAQAALTEGLSDLRTAAASLRAVEPASPIEGTESIAKLGHLLFGKAYERHLRPSRCRLRFW